MDLLMIFLLMLGVMGIGYALGLWHDASDRELKTVLLEQRLERMNRANMDALARSIGRQKY